MHKFKTSDVGLAGIAITPNRMRSLREEVIIQLMESMAQPPGLLQPIVVRPSEGGGYYLVAGYHRLESARRLKWKSITCNILDGIDVDSAQMAEIDENLVRADLSPAERVMHVGRRKELYERLHPETKPTKRGGPGRAKKTRSQNATDSVPAFIEDTAKKTGKHRATVARDAKRAKEVHEDVLPDIIGTSLDKGDEMDAMGKLPEADQKKLAAAAKSGKKVSAKAQVKKNRRADREATLGAVQVSLPDKKYGVIIADPAWRFEPYSRETGMDRAADNHYLTSPTEDIEKIDVQSIAASDCILLMWATSPMLPDALRVMAAWGFTYKTHAVWHKMRPQSGRGPGYWFTGEHELLLIGTRGDIPAPAPGTQWGSVFAAPVRAHSQKPPAAHEFAEMFYPNLQKVELNARQRRAGWDCWGNETDKFTEAAE